MDNQKLRLWLAQKLGLADVPDPVWDDLVATRHVQEATERGDAERKELLSRAKRLLHIARRLSRRRSPPGRGAPADLPDPDQADWAQAFFEDSVHQPDWGHAFAEYLARAAANTPRVRRFRKAVCGGIVEPKEAYAVIRSSTLAEHSRLALQEELPVNCRAQARPINDALAIKLVGGKPALWQQREIEDFPNRYVAYPGEDGWEQLARVDRHSVLHELKELGDWLAERYRWQPAQAVWFVLTGGIPEVPAMRVGTTTQYRGDHTRAEITLQVDARVPARAVLEAFRKYQHLILKGDNRPLGQRNLAVFRFVIARLDGHRNRRRWCELMAEWNGEQPEWHYDNSQNFARDYYRARDWLILRTYHPDTGRRWFLRGPDEEERAVFGNPERTQVGRTPRT